MQLRQLFMFFGSHAPLHDFKHFTHFPSSLSANPWLHTRHTFASLSLHCWQPFLQLRTHMPDTKFVPIMHVKHCVKFDGLHVLQLPWHGTQAPPTLFKLSKQVVQVLTDEHTWQPLGHGLHTPLSRINLGEHWVQDYGLVGSHDWQPGLHGTATLLNMTTPPLLVIQDDDELHVRQADEHGWHVLLRG
jgi:hypothetical protein